MPSNNTPEVGEVYNFITLQVSLNKATPGTFYVLQQDFKDKFFRAVLHLVGQKNGAGLTDWDALLFYSDGDICSADDDDEFRLIAVCHPNNFKHV